MLEDARRVATSAPGNGLRCDRAALHELRVGYYKLTRPKPVADDCAWLCEHSIQIGKEKCFVVLGIRLSELPPRGVALAYQHMEPLAILVVTKSTGDIVAQQLQSIIALTGMPRMIAADRGSDLHAGIKLFLSNHGSIDYLYDMKHFVASVLRRLLWCDETCREFTSLAAKSSKELQQTALAPLAPPNQRSKSRYMNLEPLLGWAAATLALLRKHRVPYEILELDRHEVVKRLGWLRSFISPLEQWRQAWQLSDLATKRVATDGYFEGISLVLRRRLSGIATTALARLVRTEILAFVAQQQDKLKPRERLVGSTEVLESLFGTFKRLQGDRGTGGLTQLALSVAAAVSPTTPQVVEEALRTVSCEDIRRWTEQMLGPTVHSKRREARSVC